MPLASCTARHRDSIPSLVPEPSLVSVTLLRISLGGDFGQTLPVSSGLACSGDQPLGGLDQRCERLLQQLQHLCSAHHQLCAVKLWQLGLCFLQLACPLPSLPACASGPWSVASAVTLFPCPHPVFLAACLSLILFAVDPGSVCCSPL